jgi:hypothetical protein
VANFGSFWTINVRHVVTFLAQLVSNANQNQPLIDIQIPKAAGFAPEPAASCAVLLD